MLISPVFTQHFVQFFEFLKRILFQNVSYWFFSHLHGLNFMLFFTIVSMGSCRNHSIMIKVSSYSSPPKMWQVKIFSHFLLTALRDGMIINYHKLRHWTRYELKFSVTCFLFKIFGNLRFTRPEIPPSTEYKQYSYLTHCLNVRNAKSQMCAPFD